MLFPIVVWRNFERETTARSSVFPRPRLKPLCSTYFRYAQKNDREPDEMAEIPVPRGHYFTQRFRIAVAEGSDRKRRCMVFILPNATARPNAKAIRAANSAVDALLADMRVTLRDRAFAMRIIPGQSDRIPCVRQVLT